MISAELKKTAKDLLKDGKVRLIIAYGENAAGDIVPFFVTGEALADKMVWNDRCYYNLTKYLTDKDVMAGQDGVTGIVVKLCDLKALKVLISERQVKRDRIKIIAIVCEGLKDESGRSLKKCETCPQGSPDRESCDVIIGEKSGRSAAEDSYGDIAEIDNLTATERKVFWDKYFEKCLRCYACRNICPLCYCRECVIEQHNPEWVSPAPSQTANAGFHAIRAYHLAGRCVDCGECERVCPVGIPLRKINRKMAKVVWDNFNFKPGEDTESKTPIAWYKENDPQDFIK
jgi:ferredoxin